MRRIVGSCTVGLLTLAAHVAFAEPITSGFKPQVIFDNKQLALISDAKLISTEPNGLKTMWTITVGEKSSQSNQIYDTQKIELDCNSQVVRVVENLIFSSDGGIFLHSKDVSPWSKRGPDTLTNPELDFACSHKSLGAVRAGTLLAQTFDVVTVLVSANAGIGPTPGPVVVPSAPPPVAPQGFTVIKCTGQMNYGSRETRFYRLTDHSIQPWIADAAAWGADLCRNQGYTCHIGSEVYFAQGDYVSDTGLQVKHTLSVFRRTGKVQEDRFTPQMGTFGFQGNCSPAPDPSESATNKF
jgi:hypothetical protein